VSESSTTAIVLRAAREIDDVRELDDDDLAAIVFPVAHWSTAVIGALGVVGVTVMFAVAAESALASLATVIALTVGAIGAELGAAWAADRMKRAALARDYGVSRALVDKIWRARVRLLLSSPLTMSQKRLRAEWPAKIRAQLTEAAPPHTRDR
jgi:hypothetical protein